MTLLLKAKYMFIYMNFEKDSGDVHTKLLAMVPVCIVSIFIMITHYFCNLARLV